MTYSMLKGLQCIIGRFQTRAPICKFSDVRESFTAKQTDRLLSFLMLNVEFFYYVECYRSKGLSLCSSGRT